MLEEEFLLTSVSIHPLNRFWTSLRD